MKTSFAKVILLSGLCSSFLSNAVTAETVAECAEREKICLASAATSCLFSLLFCDIVEAERECAIDFLVCTSK